MTGLLEFQFEPGEGGGGEWPAGCLPDYSWQYYPIFYVIIRQYYQHADKLLYFFYLYSLITFLISRP